MGSLIVRIDENGQAEPIVENNWNNVQHQFYFD
jgi:hypothetical protein